MRTARRHPRISTRDLQAHLRPGGRSPRGGRVLDLSEGGMLIAGDDLEVGEKTAFELAGTNFHYAGVAEVAHLTNGMTGLRFLSWQGPADRPVRSLIEERSDWEPARVARQPVRPVIRRVAVLVGPQRTSPTDVPLG